MVCRILLQIKSAVTLYEQNLKVLGDRGPDGNGVGSCISDCDGRMELELAAVMDVSSILFIRC